MVRFYFILPSYSQQYIQQKINSSLKWCSNESNKIDHHQAHLEYRNTSSLASEYFLKTKRNLKNLEIRVRRHSQGKYTLYSSYLKKRILESGRHLITSRYVGHLSFLQSKKMKTTISKTVEQKSQGLVSGSVNGRSGGDEALVV